MKYSEAEDLARIYLSPAMVRNELTTMYANGQRKIALNLWYWDLSDDVGLADSAVFGHVVNAKLGRLLPQHESNLKSLLNDIVNQGFNEIVLRFSAQGNSGPERWDRWYESKYLIDKSFIETTITTVEDQLKGKHVKTF